MASKSKETPLHDAARAADLLALQASLLPGSLNARDQHSRTPLHLASWAGHADVVRILCANKADVGAAVDDMAAIHFASQKGHTEVVRYLLAAGASINARTRKGMTPLHYAIQGGHTDLTKILIKRGANLDAKNKAMKRPIDLAKGGEFRSFVLAIEQEKIATNISQQESCKPGSSLDMAGLQAEGNAKEESSILSSSNNTGHETKPFLEKQGKSRETRRDSEPLKKKAKVDLAVDQADQGDEQDTS